MNLSKEQWWDLRKFAIREAQIKMNYNVLDILEKWAQQQGIQTQGRASGYRDSGESDAWLALINNKNAIEAIKSGILHVKSGIEAWAGYGNEPIPENVVSNKKSLREVFGFDKK